MFKILNNNFAEKGRCRYINDHEDVIFMKRTPEGFVGVIKFKDKRCVHKPLYVSVPVPDDYHGADVDIRYPNDPELDKLHLQNVISEFGELVNRWICMLYDLKIFEKSRDENVVKKRIQVQSLRQYPELRQMADTVFPI